MSAITPKAVRQRVAGYLAAIDGWRQSAVPMDRWTSDETALRHYEFAVGVPSTTYVDKQRPSTVTRAVTTVRIGWSSRVRVGGAVASLDDALDAEAVLTAALAAHMRSADLHLILQSQERTVTSEWVVGTLTYEAHHMVQLGS